ncbi:MAG: GNAT family N-acetyltransferase [Bacilli bacterium]
MISKYTIIKLIDNTKYLDELSLWMYNWWGKDEEWSLDKIKEYLKNSCNDEKLPQTYIALENTEVVGMCQISMYDLDVRPDLYPWLNNVYIKLEKRNLGISKLLIEYVIKEAKKMNLQELYLYTTHIGLYEKYGFKFISNIKTYLKKDHVQRLYKLDLE